MSWAYLLVASLYATATVLTFKAGSAAARPKPAASQGSPWRDLKEGMVYTWEERHLFGVMVLAVLLNVTAFPTFVSLLPAALPSIMAGLTQCIMLSLSMVVFATLIGAPSLGNPVFKALSTRNIPIGIEAGLAIVILAIALDRALAQKTGARK